MSKRKVSPVKDSSPTMPKPSPAEYPRYTDTFGCAKKTIVGESVRGLYKGMDAPLNGVTPMLAVCFFGFGIGNKIQQKPPEEELIFSRPTKTMEAKPGLLDLWTMPSSYTAREESAASTRARRPLLGDVPASGLYFASYV
ncbi:hypothetical protein MRX96_025826 [Rhipicephalus microplus]